MTAGTLQNEKWNTISFENGDICFTVVRIKFTQMSQAIDNHIKGNITPLWGLQFDLNRFCYRYYAALPLNYCYRAAKHL
ncbi:MAG: hypothetical protein V1775_01120 [Bacteroidota bacterium]